MNFDSEEKVIKRSQQLLVLSSNENNEIYLVDPKTSGVLSKYIV